MGRIIPYIMETKKWLKPPARFGREIMIWSNQLEILSNEIKFLGRLYDMI